MDNDIDFSILKDKSSARDIRDAYYAVFEVEGAYEYIKNKSSDESWMFNGRIIVNEIYDKIDKDHHSGASLACTMRVVEYIIKYGKEAWYRQLLNESKID